MWAHYADSHRGFVIEFDSAHPFFNQQLSIKCAPIFLREVEYHEERPQLTFSGLTPSDIFLAKSCDWKDEQEWRMLAPLDNSAKTVFDKGETIHLFEYPREAVTKVFLGCRSSPKLKDDLRSILSSDSRFSNTKIWRASVDPQQFKLNFICEDC